MTQTDTQKEMILEWLLLGLPLTPMESIKRFGCTKLSTRVCELVQDGFPISKRWVEVRNRFGKKVKVMQYYF